MPKPLYALFAFSFIILLYSSEAQPRLNPVCPQPGEFVMQDEFLVVATVDDFAGVLQPDQVSISINGKTVKAEVEGNVIRFAPAEGLKEPGPVSIRISVSQDDSLPEISLNWEAALLEEIKTQKTKPLNLFGRGWAEIRDTRYGSTSQTVFSTGAFCSGYSGKVRYASNIMLTSADKRNTPMQNIYWASAAYGKWVEAKFGDDWPAWNAQVLSGQRIRGAHVETHLFTSSGANPFNLQASYGLARRPIQGDLVRAVQDTEWTPGTYGRSILAVRPSFGSGKIFQLGLFLLKGRDDSGSIGRSESLMVLSASGDTLQSSTDTPKDNLVLGSDFVLRLFNRSIELFAGYALSGYTRNILGGPVQLSQIDSSLKNTPLDTDLFSSLLILNTSTTPLSPYGMGILNSSALSYGIRTDFRFSDFKNVLSAEYELRGANYYSMGSPLLGTGEKGIRLEDKIYAWKNLAQVGFFFHRFQNNLDNLESESSSTRRTGATASIFYNSKIPSLMAGYSHTQTGRPGDRFSFENGVEVLNASSAYGFRLGQYENQVQVFMYRADMETRWNTMQVDTLGLWTSGNDTLTKTNSGMAGMNAWTRFPQLPLRLSAGVTTDFGSARFHRIFLITLGGQYQLMPKRWDAQASVTFRNAKPGLSSINKNQIETAYGTHYSFWNVHKVALDGAFNGGIGKSAIQHVLKYEWNF